jgi:hypothetical protein|tara:strand:- start:138 stop:596 length:459 start_codon:yes stop_codon:yes gene_type:complete
MNKCFECEATEDLQEHHPVPRSRGGTKTVTLCYECHMKAHGRDSKGMNHGRLTEEGLQQAKRNGVKLGTHNPRVMEGRKKIGAETLARVIPHILEAKNNGCNSNRTIADYLNEKGIKTPRGKQFSKATMTPYLRHMKAQPLLVRIKKLKEEK